MMSAPNSEQDARPIAMEDKVCIMKDETPFPCDGDGDGATSQAQSVELCYLSGDFDIILSKSHVNTPYLLAISAHMVPHFPRVNVTAVFTHGGRSWNVSYIGKVKRPKFDNSDWRKFSDDNNLKCDDACVFEVLESTNEILRLRVLILRDTAALPPQLKTKIEARGKTPETAIELA